MVCFFHIRSVLLAVKLVIDRDGVPHGCGDSVCCADTTETSLCTARILCKC